MDYLIDVIFANDCEELVAEWRQSIEKLSHTSEFSSAELFKKERSVHNAHYDFVSVICGEDAGCKSGAFYTNGAAHSVIRTQCQLEVHIKSDSDDKEDSVWLVNPFEISNTQIPEVLHMWDKAKDHMVSKDGFIDACLFRAASESAHFGLINVARWRTPEKFFAAVDDKSYQRLRKQSMSYDLHPSLCKRAAKYLRDDNLRSVEQRVAN